MAENTKGSLFLGPSAIAIHNYSNVLRDIIPIDMFFVRRHGGSKLGKKVMQKREGFRNENLFIRIRRARYIVECAGKRDPEEEVIVVVVRIY
jgi:hypothetical protein